MNKRGLTIIEALVALILLATILASVAPSLTAYTSLNAKSEIRTGATYLAQQELDKLRNLEFSNWPTNPTVSTKAHDSRSYSLSFSYCAQGTSNCQTTANSRHLTIKVSYAGKEVYKVETVYTIFN